LQDTANKNTLTICNKNEPCYNKENEINIIESECFMNFTKKICIWLLAINIYLPAINQKQTIPTHTVSTLKRSRLWDILFPVPTAIYNAGRNSNDNHQHMNDSNDNNNDNDDDNDDLKQQKSNDSFYEVIYPGDITASFDDIAGLDNAKEDMLDIVAFLKNPEKFKNMGAKVPCGILMNGEPGNGKTSLARAAAGEIKCPFISVKGSDFISMWIGESGNRIRNLFKLARENAPCIIFIDEIDAVATARSSHCDSGSTENNRTVAALLGEMDGLTQHEKPVIVIGATNRADQLDPAILRPGRFDRIIEITKPLLKDRIQLLKIAFSKKPLAQNVRFDLIASATAGFSGAELANLANEATILALKSDSSTITIEHIESAYDNITLGRETRGMNISQDELWNTAVHEAGHLIGFLFQHTTMGIHKVSIIPRGNTLGIAHMVPLVENYSYTQDDMLNSIVSCLAGRFAEEAFGFGLSSGASNDLDKAQKIAYEMVVKYGMSEGMRDISYNVFRGKLPNDIATQVHNEVNKIIEKCRYTTRNLIADHKNDIEKIAHLLMKKGTVQGEEIYKLLNLPMPKGLGFIE